MLNANKHFHLCIGLVSVMKGVVQYSEVFGTGTCAI